MQNLKFVIPGPPVAQGRGRVTTINGRPRAFDPPKSAAYKRKVGWSAKQAMAGAQPFDGAVIVSIFFYIQPPTSWSEKKRQQALIGGIKPCVKPDIDNLAKAVLDGINGICFADDKQVVGLGARKQYGFPPRVEVDIREV